MKFAIVCLVLFAAIVGLEAVPAGSNHRDAFNEDVRILEKRDTSECPYVYYLWGKKYTIFCDPFCENYNKIATCVNGTCQCLKKNPTKV